MNLQPQLAWAENVSGVLGDPAKVESFTPPERMREKFVAVQARQTKGPERFPGSTEVLESCFGKMKELEKQQSRGGFASLAVSFGAMLADKTTEVIAAATEQSRTADVYRWCKDQLGTTDFGKRKLAFAEENGARQK